MDQGLWLRKGVDRDITFNGSSSRIESNKRTHQWFIDGAELDLYTYKKQAVESSNSTMPGSELPSGGPPAWDHHSNNFQSDQFANQLFQSEAAGLENFPERTVSSGDAEACISYCGLRRVKVNQAASNKEEENDDLLTGETYNGGAEAHAETTNASDSSAVAKSKPRSSRNKLDMKTSRKEAPPNSFPSNVRSLLSTGMLDGVPVMYVASSREVIRGVVKGSGYLCGCLSCNHSKVLNAFEFERHAGCKTKHPNNHIYFENGKTIYQIVQELRSTPESKLFDAIQTVFGAPINQKSFKIWKESFQAATRELQRIYGKEEMNL